MENLALLRVLRQAGCQFVVMVPALGGLTSKVATPEQALRLADDKDGVRAELMGLSKADYQEWVANQGAVYCSGETVEGRPCRNNVVGGTSLAPQGWMALRDAGGYCSAHGGSTV
jgi:hypothetical protein